MSQTSTSITSPGIISPGHGRSPVDGKNSLSELPWCGKINLRGNPENAEFLKKAEASMGIPVATEPNTLNMDHGRTCFWLGPDEWLIHCDLQETDELIENLNSNLSGIHSAVVDVSDYYTVLRLDGPDSSRLLAKACPLDLHPSKFNTGSCAQTRFGHASILLHQISAIPAYNIQVRWSYTEYVWDYLVSGMSAI